MIIAIDGPSGAGKGTVARAVSEKLGYRHIDTGAMYRAVGWKALHDGLALDDEAAMAALAEHANLVVEAGVVAVDGHAVMVEVKHYGPEDSPHDPLYGRIGNSIYNWNGGHPNGETDTPPRE